MIRTRALSLCAAAVGASLVLAACGSSGSGSGDTATSSGSNSSAAGGSTGAGAASATPAASATASAGGAAANPFPTPSPYPKGSKAVSGMPAITANATDFEKEPVTAKGTGSDPKNLFTRDLIVGTGQEAAPSATVKVRYVGTLFSDGTVFDSSWKDNGGPNPTTFSLAQVVPGFAGGIVGMKIGGRREIVIPGFLAYGANPPPGSTIGENATLVFVVDLVGLA